MLPVLIRNTRLHFISFTLSNTQQNNKP
jgi:hypothetical protein